MASLWTCIILVCALSYCDCVLRFKNKAPIKKRVADLEYQVNTYFAQFRQDVNTLVEIINDLNSTIIAQQSSQPPVAGGGSSVRTTEKMDEIVEKMELFMSEQTMQMKRIEKAFVEEKKIRQEIENKVNLDKKDNNALSTELFNEMIETVNGRIDQETNERNETIEDIILGMGTLTDKVQVLTDTLEKLQATGIPVSANVGIPGKAVPACPTSAWVQWQNMCYLHVTNESVIWEIASMRCQDHGGILAEPDTKEAMLRVLDLVYVKSANVWIGAADEKKEGTWLWASSGKEVSYFKWESGQPNNMGGIQNCMEMYQGYLNDDRCNTGNQYVCQRNTYQQ